MDLPHTPSTAWVLHRKTVEITRSFYDNLITTRKVPQVNIAANLKTYGSKVDFIIYSVDHCVCKEIWCPYKKYPMIDTVLRIKTDLDLVILEAFFNAHLKMWGKKPLCEDSDSDISDTYPELGELVHIC